MKKRKFYELAVQVPDKELVPITIQDNRVAEKVIVLPGTRVHDHRRIVQDRYLEGSTKGGVVLPGGNSSQLWDWYEERGWLAILQKIDRPMLGTCAGLIILIRLGLLPVEVKRGGFGFPWFETRISTKWGEMTGEFCGAPQIVGYSEDCEVLARLPSGRACAVRYQGIVGTSFHPESSSCDWFHRHL